MAAITRIDVRLKTGFADGASTDGDVYLSIGGREFSLDSADNDFQAKSDRTYTLGTGANVQNASDNNPSKPFQLRTENLDRFPVYLRFAPQNRDDKWNVGFVSAVVNPGPQQVQFQALGGNDNLWLGTHAGLTCHLAKS